MTPQQRAFGRMALKAMAEFYSNPENERRYEEWKRKRRGAATNETRATPKQASTV